MPENIYRLKAVGPKKITWEKEWIFLNKDSYKVFCCSPEKDDCLPLIKDSIEQYPYYLGKNAVVTDGTQYFVTMKNKQLSGGFSQIMTVPKELLFPIDEQDKYIGCFLTDIAELCYIQRVLKIDLSTVRPISDNWKSKLKEIIMPSLEDVHNCIILNYFMKTAQFASDTIQNWGTLIIADTLCSESFNIIPELIEKHITVHCVMPEPSKQDYEEAYALLKQHRQDIMNLGVMCSCNEEIMSTSSTSDLLSTSSLLVALLNKYFLLEDTRKIYSLVD